MHKKACFFHKKRSMQQSKCSTMYHLERSLGSGILTKNHYVVFRHFLVSHLRFIGHRVDAFFRRFHIDFDKR
jgi:hypothetical protein